MSGIGGIGYGRQQWSNTAPESPPVQADDRLRTELARTDRGWARALDEVEKADACTARAQRIVAAAQALVSKWESMYRCYQSTEESVQLADLLDALAREMGKQ